jgi:hypothetical protein
MLPFIDDENHDLDANSATAYTPGSIPASFDKEGSMGRQMKQWNFEKQAKQAVKTEKIHIWLPQKNTVAEIHGLCTNLALELWQAW